MLVLVSAASLVRMEYWVTSLPVPEVVGTRASGSTFLGSKPNEKRASSAISGWLASMAMALAASMGLPPPIPTIKSAPKARALSPPLRTLGIVGLLSTSSKTA